MATGDKVGPIGADDGPVGLKLGTAVGLLLGPLGARVGDGVKTVPPEMRMVPEQLFVE